MKNPILVYPIGGGGHWLSAMIRQLESGDLILPQGEIWFDHLPGSDNIKSDPHGAEWHRGYFDPHDLSDYDPVILFSTEYAFNLYLLEAGKAKLNPNRVNNIVNMHMIDQFFDLSNHARFIISDKSYIDFYCRNISLNNKLIFQNPDQFVTDLFAILDQCQLSFCRNRQFCLDSIKVFVKSCYNPKDYLANFDSIVWLAWCEALSVLYDIPLDGILNEAKSIHDIADILYPHKDRFVSLTKTMMFEWK